MATADCAGGGASCRVLLCSGNPALLRGHRAFPGRILRGTREIARKTKCRGWWRRIRLGALCAAAPTGTDPPIRAIFVGGRGERSGSAAGSCARVARRRRRFTLPIADGFLERKRDRSAFAGSSRFFRACVSSALCGRHPFTVQYALERAYAI